MVRTKKRFRVELWAFKGGYTLCSALSAGAGGVAAARHGLRSEEMRHKGVLSFFGFGNLKNRQKIFPKSGTDFR